MKSKFWLQCACFGLCFASLSGTALAQKFEVHPYATLANATKWNDFQDVRTSGLYGARGGVFLTRSLEVEGNFGVMNHFEFENVATKARGILWDVNGVYNYFSSNIPRLVPYVTAGIGGVTTVNLSTPLTFTALGREYRWENRDTFFGFNYGAGLKGLRLSGPFGIRGDVRGRTLPNVFGRKVLWFEGTFGIDFTWGER